MSALSVSIWDFAVYRFLTGLGVGGEFAVGVALVAEVMPDRARPHALGWLQASSAVGNMIAAVAGSLYAYFLGSLEPGFLSIDQSLGIVAMVLLGGRSAVAAPVVGAFVLTTLPHLIHFSAEIRSIVYGAILIFTILVMPQGIYGSLWQLLRRGHAA